MKYFESQSDFTSTGLNSPVDLVRFIVTCVFLAPIRLVLEVSKKIMFTGEHFKKFIINCIYINSAMILISILVSLFITKRFYIYGSLLPISSLVISFGLLFTIYFFSPRFMLEVDFNQTEDLDKQMDNISKVYGVSEDEISSETTEPSPNKRVEDNNQKAESSPNDSFDDYDELEISTDDDFDKVYSDEVINQTSKLSPDVRESTRAKLEEFKANFRANTNLHPPSINVKNGYGDVREQEDAKIGIIRDVYSSIDSDNSDDVIKNASSILRTGRLPSFDINDIEADDSPMNTSPISISDYNKNINRRVNRKTATLDSLISNSNGSVMIDEEDELKEDKVDNASNFGDYLNIDSGVSPSDTVDLSVDDMAVGIAQDLYYNGGIPGMGSDDDFDYSFMG